MYKVLGSIPSTQRKQKMDKKYDPLKSLLKLTSSLRIYIIPKLQRWKKIFHSIGKKERMYRQKEAKYNLKNYKLRKRTK
jgi:hypothetical protein